jgi:hypothetical protein
VKDKTLFTEKGLFVGHSILNSLGHFKLGAWGISLREVSVKK